MKLEILVGITSLVTGVILLIMGTDYGKNFEEITGGVFMGAIMILLGSARLRRTLHRSRR
jgi:hypothetical protein